MFSRLIMLWSDLGREERRVLIEIADRLRRGQETYGLLENNDKDMIQEAHEEFLDASVYLAKKTLGRRA